jgi:hypothetical protein
VTTEQEASAMRKLTDELIELSKQQMRALQAATYFKMTPQEAREYDIRAERIKELSILLGTYRPD